MTDSCLRFLERVWALQPDVTEGVAYVSAKDWDTGDWTDQPTDPTDPELPTTKDLYFAPCLFNDQRRVRRNALPGRWLYADLDEVDPVGLDLEPTLAWETSPGRYQAMWLLDRPVSPRRLEQLNQRLTYYTGADKGGWSLTKVLRVPGSVSTKREDPYRVHLLPTASPPPTYPVEDVSALLRHVETPASLAQSVPMPSKWPDPQRTLRRYRRQLPVRARQLLSTQTAVRGDDRSARLWELENLLLDAGVPPKSVLVLVKPTVWNKYKGQRRENRALWNEITKAAQNRADPQKPKKKRKSKKATSVADIEPTSFRDFMTRALPRATWLVEGIWSDTAHGMLAGEPKTFKTLFLLDLSVSIASGKPFLGRFAVPRKGPVLIIQEENTPGDMQDRLMRIASSRGVGPSLSRNGSDAVLNFGEDLPVYLLNNQGFSFTDEEWMKWLERQIRKIKPVLVAFDPLYLVAKGIDENSAAEMTPILSNLLRLKQTYDCGMLIVHHYHKPKSDSHGRSAARMSGTGVFHRWLASAIYVERPSEEDSVVKISGEHRSHGQGGAYRVEFDLGTDDDLHYEAEVDYWRDSDTAGETVVEVTKKVVETQVVIPDFDEPTQVRQLAKQAGVRGKQMQRALKDAGYQVKRDGETYETKNGTQRYLIAYPKDV